MKRNLSLYAWIHDTHIKDNWIIFCDNVSDEIMLGNYHEYMSAVEKLMSLYHFCHKRYGDFA